MKKQLIKLLLTITAITISIVGINNLMYQVKHEINLENNRTRTDESRLNDSIIITKINQYNNDTIRKED